MSLSAIPNKLAGMLLQVGTEFLLCKRAPDQGTLANTWTCPAGHVEPGESPCEGAIREFQEETQLSLSVDSHKITLLSFGPSVSRTGTFFLFHATHWEKLTPVLDHEHTEWGYFTRGSLPDPISKETAAWIEQLS